MYRERERINSSRSLFPARTPVDTPEAARDDSALMLLSTSLEKLALYL